MMDTPAENIFNQKKHILYWKRCLKTFLPEQYTSMDSNRMMLGFFILSALDLLNSLESSIDWSERTGYINWIYSCQHQNGGFRGSPAVHGNAKSNQHYISFEPAQIANTFFALAALAILDDDFERFDERKCLSWLVRMQKNDGSFGEQLNENDEPVGTMSIRFGYCASAIRQILNGGEKKLADDIPDINITELIKRIYSSSTYDGGLSETSFHESHAGFTYCAIGTLHCLNHLPVTDSKQLLKPYVLGNSHSDKNAELKKLSHLFDASYTTRWLIFRQSTMLEAAEIESSQRPAVNSEYTTDTSNEQPFSENSTGVLMQDEFCIEQVAAGFNGRCNKVADTCYAFWVEASLAMLGHLDLIDTEGCREYLLRRTQHMIGGFGKIPGDPPDIYHSYLGLAALAITGEDGLAYFDPALCMSKRAAARFDTLSLQR